jgi:hypothetical protein
LLRSEGVPCFHRPTGLDVEAGGGDFGGPHAILVDQIALVRARDLLAAGEPLSAECVECGRRIGEDGRWYSDGAGQLVPYCDGCAEREFGSA